MQYFAIQMGDGQPFRPHKGKDISKGVVRKILTDLELMMEGFEKYL